jgi:hypothetical protein
VRQVVGVIGIAFGLLLLFQGIRFATFDPDDGDLGTTGLIVYASVFVACGLLSLVVRVWGLRRRN